MYDYVLKLERINEWYNSLVEDLGLREVVSSGWPSENKCFLSTPSNKCNGPRVVVDVLGGVRFVSPDISP